MRIDLSGWLLFDCHIKFRRHVFRMQFQLQRLLVLVSVHRVCWQSCIVELSMCVGLPNWPILDCHVFGRWHVHCL
jgi:hypothetical protein